MAEQGMKVTRSDEEKALWEQVRLAILQRVQAAVATATAAELREFLELYRDFYER